ncbi:MAG: four helix bundle protein [Chloracidobacterium sp.]|nr:four helix bundle protein [Chloracidobacterium sp.]
MPEPAAKRESVLRTKSYAFGVRVVRLSQFLVSEHREYVLSRQILRSGTAIGALVREAEYGISKADFRNKMSIALKEANETEYWLSILRDTDYLDEKLFRSLSVDCVELIKILIATVKTTQPG